MRARHDAVILERKAVLSAAYELHRLDWARRHADDGTFARAVERYHVEMQDALPPKPALEEWLASEGLVTDVSPGTSDAFETREFRDTDHMERLLRHTDVLLRSWRIAPRTGHPITAEQVRNALDAGMARIRDDDPRACAIGCNWFWFLNDDVDAEAYLRTRTRDEMARDIASTLAEFEEDDNFETEWSYYRALLDEMP